MAKIVNDTVDVFGEITKVRKKYSRGKKVVLQEITDDMEELPNSVDNYSSQPPHANEGRGYLVEEEKFTDKQDFLDSIGLGKRPGSQLAIDKWEEYRSK